MKNWTEIACIGLLTASMAGGLVSCSSKSTVSNDGMSSSGASADMSAAGHAESANDLDTVYFAYDEASLNKATRDELKKNAQWLKTHPGSTIQIEGHCDERGTTEYNLALGERRAQAAKHYLLKLGVDASRISTISYGNERPADPGHDEDAWAKNRRAVSVVLSNGTTANAK